MASVLQIHPVTARAFIARLRRLVAPALLTLLVWAVVAAQSTTSELVNPSSISFEHDGRDVTGFVAYISSDGAPPRRVDLGAIHPDARKIVVSRMPSLPAGVYSIEVAAYNAAGESPRVPAVPNRFRVTEERDRPADSGKPARKEPAKSTRGLLGRIYGVVVGADEEDAGK